jgi:hypothetical protein
MVRDPSPGSHLMTRSDLSHKGRSEGKKHDPATIRLHPNYFGAMRSDASSRTTSPLR